MTEDEARYERKDEVLEGEGKEQKEEEEVAAAQADPRNERDGKVFVF